MTQIEILNPKAKPVSIQTLDPKYFLRLYSEQLTNGQKEVVRKTYKEVNILHEDYVLKFKIKRAGIWFASSVQIPKGMVLNGSSVPAIGKAIVNEDYHNKAWPAHDMIYICKGAETRSPMAGLYSPSMTRKEADQLFRATVKLSGAPRFQIGLAYAAIRIGGSRLWAKQKRKEHLIKVEIK